ncbi:DUF4158 domain-containing protein [Scytonema tolypothrichoides VB-61278]|nr:DUF4158 domain-containing protein [Scytonema tolypothrichoides VB-61278]
MSESATVMDNPADLMDVAIAELIKHRYELPGFTTLVPVLCKLNL